MDQLELAKLTVLMNLTLGIGEVAIGLIDGPVSTLHPDLASENVREIKGNNGTCAQLDSAACMHGTFVAGILSAKRNTAAPAICPGCTLLIRPIFLESPLGGDELPKATPLELAKAIHDCIDSGARVINLSLAAARPSLQAERSLEEALNRAMTRNVIIVAAAGNQGMLGSTVITRHPWVISVVGCDLSGNPLCSSNLGNSIGRRGLCAPGESVTSLSSVGQLQTSTGTSAAAPFVTGAIALLWSEFPTATAMQLKLAVCSSSHGRRASIVPPLLNAAEALESLLTAKLKRIA